MAQGVVSVGATSEVLLVGRGTTVLADLEQLRGRCVSVRRVVIAYPTTSTGAALTVATRS